MHDDLFDGENECDPRVKLVETSIKDAERTPYNCSTGPRHKWIDGNSMLRTGDKKMSTRTYIR